MCIVSIIVFVILANAAADFLAGLPTGPSENPSTVRIPTPFAAETLAALPGAGAQVSEKDGMRQVLVPAGAFGMGASDAQFQAEAKSCVKALDKLELWCESKIWNESPAHQVSLDAFWIDQMEVTNAMYAKCVGAGACTAPQKNYSNARSDYYLSLIHI